MVNLDLGLCLLKFHIFLKNSEDIFGMICGFDTSCSSITQKELLYQEYNTNPCHLWGLLQQLFMAVLCFCHHHLPILFFLLESRYSWWVCLYLLPQKETPSESSSLHFFSALPFCAYEQYLDKNLPGFILGNELIRCKPYLLRDTILLQL